MTATAHYENSTLRERIVEHVFIGDALRALWKSHATDVEILRSEFDAHGYDLVMARGRIVRHIQFKAGQSAKPGPVSISRSLAAKPSGCVLWMHVSDELQLGPFFWFGGPPGDPLPDIAGFQSPKRPTHNKSGERPLRKNHCLVPGNKFERVNEIHEVLVRLFGSLQANAPQ